jgi:seryl-tRNA synthetase
VTIELYRLREDVKNQTQELSNLQSRNRECQNALSESQSQLLPVQFDLMKVSKEKDLLSRRLTELESEMEKIDAIGLEIYISFPKS